MLANDLLRAAQLHGQLTVAAVCQHARPHRLPLRRGQTLEQRQGKLALAREILHPSQIIIIQQQHRHPETLTRALIDPTPPHALPQLVLRNTKQPSHRRSATRPVAPACQQRRRKRLAREISRQLIRTRPTRQKPQDHRHMATVELPKRIAITGHRRHQQLIVPP